MVICCNNQRAGTRPAPTKYFPLTLTTGSILMKTYRLPKGFLANGIHCGLKNKRKDLSLLYSEIPCKVAAIFTKNLVKAAPVVVAMEQLRKSRHFRAILVNSGNANCMTGERGIRDARKMARGLNQVLDVPEETVLVSSTGVIGEFMPMEPMINGMPRLAAGLSPNGVIAAAEGIMTTDRFHKVASRVFTVGGKIITMTGIAKGAGMIDPNMATMLCFVLTDANISQKALKRSLSASADVTFNAITVDGDMSTNDTAMVMANGEAGNRLIKDSGRDFALFQKNLNEITGELARMIVRDGEGANKFVEVRVKGGKNEADAKKAAKAVANSLLVKCAVHGGDPNWGRVASSIGASGIKFDPAKLEIVLDGVTFFKNGRTILHGKSQVISVFKGEDVSIEVNLHSGRAEAVVCTCDISKKYITINSYYTT